MLCFEVGGVGVRVVVVRAFRLARVLEEGMRAYARGGRGWRAGDVRHEDLLRRIARAGQGRP